MSRYNEAIERWPDNVFDFTRVGNEVYVDACVVYNGCGYDGHGDASYYLDGTETDKQRELLAFVDGVIGF